MARRIVKGVPENSWANESRSQLRIDDWLEVHWRNSMAFDDGNVLIEPAGFSVTRFGTELDSIQTYATITNIEDQEWIRQASRTDKMTRVGEKPDPGHLGRLHAIRDENGVISYEIEILTGVDCKHMVRSAQLNGLLLFIREHWLLIGVGVAVALWWLN